MKEHLERSDKAGVSLLQPQRDKTAPFFFNVCHLCSCGSFDIYMAKMAQQLQCLMAVFLQQRALQICSVLSISEQKYS